MPPLLDYEKRDLRSAGEEAGRAASRDQSGNSVWARWAKAGKITSTARRERMQARELEEGAAEAFAKYLYEDVAFGNALTPLFENGAAAWVLFRDHYVYKFIEAVQDQERG